MIIVRCALVSILMILPLFSLHLSAHEDNGNHNKFRRLIQELPTPNTFRTASGAPGKDYFQQRADYRIIVELDEQKKHIVGSEEITYHNNSAETLQYLWLQLEQNIRAQASDAQMTATVSMRGRLNFKKLNKLHQTFDGGFKIEFVRDGENRNLHFSINKTMMRIDLPAALPAGEKMTLRIAWWYNLNDRVLLPGRSGFEYFPEEDNAIYTIAQFFPRMAVYNEIEGWQTKQFLGEGEFALNFGDYYVEITVPADHIVAATGALQNPAQVLSQRWQKRLQQARKSDKPVLIITEKEARMAEKNHATEKKTWIFTAKNVRDFAFASSRKFIWDAMGVQFGDRSVLAMSFYPKEGNPIWGKNATKVVAHTLKTYSQYTFDYPYPIAQVVHSQNIGMEYPMICFAGGRPAREHLSAKTMQTMISVIIHEIGHNYFPMIVNSDERQWAWMDEGINSFLQYRSEQAWQKNYPSRRGPAYSILEYMKSDKSILTPVMTNAESLFDFGMNAYAKPAAAFKILRENIIGPQQFDFALREYTRRWKFKHPTPADFFRTMEDASGMDLDWFWRGWFFTTDYVDLAITGARLYKIHFPGSDAAITGTAQSAAQRWVAKQTNDGQNAEPAFPLTLLDGSRFTGKIEHLNLQGQKHWRENNFYYELTFANEGGLVMPLVIRFAFVDGGSQTINIPAEIWRRDHRSVTKVFVLPRKVTSITLDPDFQMADVDMSNNYWPRTRTQIQRYKSQPSADTGAKPHAQKQ